MESVFVRTTCSLSSIGRMIMSRTVRSQVGGIAVCLLCRHTGVAVKLPLICCLMMRGSRLLAGWKSWFNTTGNSAPQVRLDFTIMHVIRLAYINNRSFLCSVFGLDVWLAADERISGNLSPVQQDLQNSFMLLSMLPTTLPKVGQSRVPPLTAAGLQFQVSDLGKQTGVESFWFVCLFFKYASI